MFSSEAVKINGVKLSKEQINELEQMLQIRIPDGSYWYDKISGAWGMEGDSTNGIISPGLNIGGPLNENASNGNTGIFVNGRHLDMNDAKNIQKLIQITPGHFWLDRQGNFGHEGETTMANLWALAKSTANSNRSFSVNSSFGTVAGDEEGNVYYQGYDGTSYSS